MSSILVEGRISALFMLLLTSIVVYWNILQAKKGKRIDIRRLPALDAITESVGRAAEMGRPVFGNIGSLANLTRYETANSLACIAVLGYTAEMAAEYGVPLIAPVGRPELLPIVTETIRDNYIKAGKPEDFVEDNIHFLSPDIRVFASHCIGLMEREQPAANIMVGEFSIELLPVAEVAGRAGAINIGGCARLSTMPFIAVACDYMLIGEEILAAGAYISREPLQVGSLAGTDLVKYLSVVLMILGAIAFSFGIPIIKDLLSL